MILTELILAAGARVPQYLIARTAASDQESRGAYASVRMTALSVGKVNREANTESM